MSGKAKIIDVYIKNNDVIKVGNDIATLCFIDDNSLTRFKINQCFNANETKKLHVDGNVENFFDVRTLLQKDSIRPLLQSLVDQKEAKVNTDGRLMKKSDGTELCELSKLGLSYDKNLIQF